MKYVYGIIRSDQAVADYAPFAFASATGRFEVITAGELAAVVSDASIHSFGDVSREQLMRYLALHQRAIETLMQWHPILPMKFGTLLTGDQQVCSVLSIGHDEFMKAMESVGTRHEVDVAVTWDPRLVLAKIATNPEVVALKTQAEALPPAQRTQAGIALGQLVKGQLDAQRNQLRDQLVSMVTPCAAQGRLNPIMDDTMVMNVACLVNDEEEEALEDRVTELDAQFGGKLNFRLVGPLPPYSFATVQARMVQQADLESACSLLEVPASSTPEQVKLAYYRQARQCHPDLVGDDPNARTRFMHLTDAYRLMTEIAQRVPATNGGMRNGTPHILLRVGGPEA